MISHLLTDAKYFFVCQQQADIVEQVNAPTKAMQAHFLPCIYELSMVQIQYNLLRMKKKIVCAGICGFIFLALGIFTLAWLPAIIKDVILDGVVLSPETYETWGANPGSTNTLTLRNFTFFNFTNPRGFLYRNQKPKFNEITNFLYQEWSNFTDYYYSQDKSVLNYNFWLYFTILQNSRNVNDIITVLNLAPLGFWTQLDTVSISSFAIQGFGGLFVEMNNTIKMQAIGQGVAGQYLPNLLQWNHFCLNFKYSDDFCLMIWDDPNYGLSDQNNYQIWVNWAYYGDKSAEMVLYEYFGFQRAQMKPLELIIKNWCQSVDDILDNWYCSGQPCKNYDLTILQLSQVGLTANPPSGNASDSICLSDNITCQGYPELYAYYKYVFLPNNNDSSFRNLIFSEKTVRALFTPYTGIFLNVGNLTELFQTGQKYDKNQKDATLLSEIQRMTHADSDKHAIVIWQYAKYFTYQFVLKTSSNGIRKIAGIAGVFSAALYQSFINFSEWFLQQQLSILVAQYMPDCSSFLTETIEGINPNIVALLCKDVNQTNYRQYWRVIQPCQNQFYLQQFKDDYDDYGILNYHIGQLCNINQNSVRLLVDKAHQQIYIKYNCSANKNKRRCTQFQLGLKQFINSTVTLNPITSKIKQYPIAASSYAWSQEFGEWEYRHFLKEIYGNVEFDKQTFDDYGRMVDLLSFDKLFSVPMVQNLLLMTDQKEFQKLFYWQNKTLLIEYIRFVTVQVGFGGFIQKRSATQLLFGYQDEFLKSLKQMDPMMGGDPSIDTTVSLNQPNSTLAEAYLKPQSMYSGYSDPLLTRSFISNINKTYITYNKTYYDGYKIISQMTTPFKQEVKLFGSDAFQNKPMCQKQQNQYIYIDTLYRVGELNYDRDVDRYGFQLHRYVITDKTLGSTDQYPENDKYYQSISGFMNLSFLGIPLFAGKSHFYQAKGPWANLIQMYDESGKYLQKASHYDDTELVIEPKTGASFTATIYLQNSIYLDQDILFPREPHMLPVFTIYRSGNLTEQAAEDLLGDLKTALVAPKKLILLSISGMLLMLFCICGCLLNRKNREIPQSLLQSQANMEEQI